MSAVTAVLERFLGYDFAVDGVLAGAVVGALCGAIGTFTVLRRLALVGDATGHATLPGVALAFLLTGSKSLSVLLLGALVSGLIANFAVAWLSKLPRSRPDAAIGVVLAVSFGLGIVLLSAVQASPTGAQSGLQSFLFGSAAAVSRAQVVTLAILGTVVLTTMIVGWRHLTLATFDPVYARSIGVRTGALDTAVFLALAVVVVMAIQTVGVVLVAAMLIIPPSAGLALTRRLPATVATASVIGAASGAVGALLSFARAGLSTGPTMVLVATGFLALALGWRRLRGGHR